MGSATSAGHGLGADVSPERELGLSLKRLNSDIPASPTADFLTNYGFKKNKNLKFLCTYIVGNSKNIDGQKEDKNSLCATTQRTPVNVWHTF